jgi:tetratricopeptide (TPR) repeat protein
MKKILILTCLVLCTGNIFGQKEFDYILRSKAFIDYNKPDNAIDLLEKAIGETRDSRFYLLRAEAYLLKGDYSGAISDYNEANKINSSSGEFGLSRVYALKGDATTALYHLEENLKSPFKKSEKEILLNKAFMVIENRSEWRQFWKKEWYSSTEKNISEIEYYISAGKLDESKAVLDELKKSYPNSDDFLYAEGLVNLSSGNYSAVINSVSRLLVSDVVNEKYLRLLAKAQIGISNPAGASVTYSQLINTGVADAEILILRADCYRKTGESVKALSDIERYLELYPDNKVAISLAGKVEASSGDNLKAIEYFSKNLKLYPNDPECYIDRANSYFVSKSWNWAIKDYSMSLDLKPGNSEIWLEKGIALLNSGKVEDACHDFRKSLSLGNKRASEYISRSCIK